MLGVSLMVAAALLARAVYGAPVKIAPTELHTVKLVGQVRWTVPAAAELTRGQVEIVALPAAGRVDRLWRRVGDSLSVGDSIAAFLNPELTASLFDAEQRLLQARADHEAQSNAARIEQLKLDDDVATARTQLRRTQQQLQLIDLLIPRQLASATEREQSLYEVLMATEHLDRAGQRRELTISAAAALARSRSDQRIALARAVDLWRTRIDQLTIRAAGRGVVSDLFVEPGQWITQGSPVLRIRTGEDLFGEVKLSDIDAADVRAGNAVIVRFRTDSAVGSVIGVDPVAKSGVVAARFRVPRATGDAPKGESLADVDIVTASSSNVLIVNAPVGARSNTSGRALVLGSDRSHAAWRAVRWGRRTGTMLEVRGGLNIGEIIIITSDSPTLQAPSLRVRIGA
ncbi:HlyD family efflux transporter periplasmic adaptor subunit [Gemmatimonas sp.]|uniref:efflux RND transporter periplasmic adaptor subunit n=1 Tax=Gemmatimonas sp. TaxID=1962908 RepID=UPI00286D96B9|nr:HlyD family efflux transporter periplasmic adaptor subunit [Gemmatimonas sp.]